MSYYQFNRPEILRKKKRKIFKRKSFLVLFRKQRGDKRKVKKLIQKLVTRKRQD